MHSFTEIEMIHACFGMGCIYEGWDGECHGRGYGKPDAACNEDDEPCYGEDADEDWEDEE